jgi:hypothetical protein
MVVVRPSTLSVVRFLGAGVWSGGLFGCVWLLVCWCLWRRVSIFIIIIYDIALIGGGMATTKHPGSASIFFFFFNLQRFAFWVPGCGCLSASSPIPIVLQVKRARGSFLFFSFLFISFLFFFFFFFFFLIVLF